MNTTDQNKPVPQKISAIELKPPGGGGTIKGSGDSFKADAFSGSGSYAVPVPVTPARGFEPELQLVYNSGAGNGAYGLGFSLSLSKIAVNTGRHIPRYDDTDEYQLDGAALTVSTITTQVVNDISYTVTTYLTNPNINFSLIQKWEDPSTRLSFWKTITTANVTSIYGNSDLSRVANPDDSTQIFEWLIDNSYDAKGNKIVYTYLEENNENVPLGIFEINRNYKAGRYIDTISYGNYWAKNVESFAFNVVFNYGVGDNNQWACRPDPFSYYNAGFEIRVFRLCEKIQMVHHFPDELGDPLMVKELYLEYENIQSYTPIKFQAPSLLKSIVLNGYQKDVSDPQSVPPLEFGFSSFQPPVAPLFKELEMDLNTIPGYLNTAGFLPVDLNREGLPGFLYSTDNSSFYMEPLGDGKYQAPMVNDPFPINKNIQNGAAVLTDINGDGYLDLLVHTANEMGYFPRKGQDGWNNYTPFVSYPNNYSSPYMELVDLDANGKTDMLLADLNSLQVFTSLGTEGYTGPSFISNDNDFPLAKQGYKQEMVTFADMFGDGLSHRVKISSGSVECWPCLGYGRFGKKVMIGNAPLFGDNFDTSRLFLADTDGSGTTDFVYVHPDKVELFLNQSGNTFSDPVTIHLPELFDTLDSISFADILGNGTTCLVFTKISPTPRQYYYNFSGEILLPDGTQQTSLKPYLLNVINNNIGVTQIINYCSSVKFYLEDKKNGQPWITRLPFPVQVVEKITIYEAFSQSKYTTRYSYHNGYYDGYNRQFKGFGLIESWDTESYEAFQDTYQNPDYPVTSLNEELYVPPVYTKSWYMNGCNGNDYTLLMQDYATAYFNGDTQAYLFPLNTLPDLASSDDRTIADAYLALAGKIIRKEIYGDDNTDISINPYQVEQSCYEVTLLQAATPHNPAVFRTDLREKITYNYERNTADPRVSQEFIFETDPASGLPELSCTMYLPRRAGVQQTCAEQLTLKGVITSSSYFDSADSNDYRLRGIPYANMQYELLNANFSGNYYTYDGANTVVTAAMKQIVAYMATPPTGVCARQFSGLNAYFWSLDQEQVLPLGQVSPRALLHHIATTAFTNDNITSIFGDRLAAETISELGGYIYNQDTSYWENHGLIQSYYKTTESYYMAAGTQSSASQLGAMNTVVYDNYNLQPVITTTFLSEDPLITNVITATVDYQSMQIKQLEDSNGNVTQCLFDALGQVTVSSAFGWQGSNLTGGMVLFDYKNLKTEYVVRTTAPGGGDITFSEVIKDQSYFLQGASSYFYYNLAGIQTSNQPISAINLVRENYYHQGGITVTDTPNQAVVTYNDGLLRQIETRTKATDVPETADKWLSSGRKVYNNKGKECESYISFFATIPDYQTQDEITSLYKVPPPTLTHYDPLERVIRVDTPKGFFTKTAFNAWQQSAFDEDDTVKSSVYYQNFMASYPVSPTQQEQDEKDALDKAAVFDNTPSLTILDNMGFTIRTINTLVAGQQPPTFIQVDISGRKVLEIDPRLYDSNINNATTYYNFAYQYSMGAKNAMLTDSIDAGKQLHFSNIFDLQTWSLSPRNYCQVISYDWMQRKLQLKIKLITTTGPISNFDNFSLVEIFNYGEYAPATAQTGNNLRGQLYQQNDLSGVLMHTSYSITGSLLASSRKMTQDYKTPVNWNKTVPLQVHSYDFAYTFNAIGKQLTQTTPDGSVVSYTYNYQALTTAITLKNSQQAQTAAIKSISYNASNQRTNVVYGNDISTNYTYEDTTQRMLQLTTLRTTLDPKTVQNINYTYDPVGNGTRIRDLSIDTVFNNNQQIDPLLDYTYDALYQLTQASGRQHQGINATTYRNNIADGSFMQSKYAPLSDGNAIEQYKEIYTYDNSGNMVKKQHIATSASWTQDTAVMDNSNRLADVTYDASGNPLFLQINDQAQLVFNCCENLLNVPVITRPDEDNDADYYLYDAAEQRSRKVSEKYATATSVRYDDSIYVDNYLYNEKGTQLDDGTRTSTDKRQTIRIMDDKACVLIFHYWTQGGPQNADSSQYRYQLGNNLGSVAVELDQQGQLISYEEYYPFGGTAIIAGSNQVDVSAKIYRYSGKECDNTTGLYYYGQRYYVSWLGRWLNPDPAGTTDGLNVYAFVKGNPVTHVDEEGLMLRSIARLAAGVKIRPRLNVRNMSHSSRGGAAGSGGEEEGALNMHDLANSTQKVTASKAIVVAAKDKAVVEIPSLVYCRGFALSLFGENQTFIGTLVTHFEGSFIPLQSKMEQLLQQHAVKQMKLQRLDQGHDRDTPPGHSEADRADMDNRTQKLLNKLQPKLGDEYDFARQLSDANTAQFKKKYDSRSLVKRTADRVMNPMERLVAFYKIMPGGSINSVLLPEHVVQYLIKYHGGGK
ncbi:SpvB/TcaC N-terminal domain-containing protein [Chitinophaga sp.]|uniref:SpvB/TcaC N-terminal domain-containing protein n=1 Tax=Chitinophaga sp. TaxID=1869181 RepID=UPI002F95B929